MAGGERQHYFLPLACGVVAAGSEARQNLLPATLAELRQTRREGALVDALSQDGFALALAEAVQREVTLPARLGDGGNGEIRFVQTPAYAELRRRSGWSVAGSAPSSRTARCCSKTTRCSRSTGGRSPGRTRRSK